MLKTAEIQIRDPFVYTDHDAKCYYLFGTTDRDCWRGPGVGFDCYRSTDLEHWEGPIAAFRPTPDFWGTQNYGTLLMLWSSLGTQGYAMGVSRSVSGHVTGPWQHDPEPFWAADGGHGMIFKTLDGRLMLTFHCPNHSPNERAVFVAIEETAGRIQRKGWTIA